VNGWRTSSYTHNQALCVEAGTARGGVGVRDTKQAGSACRTVLEFPAGAWQEFTASLKAVVTAP
jgi:hypothetical protein